MQLSSGWEISCGCICSPTVLHLYVFILDWRLTLICPLCLCLSCPGNRFDWSKIWSLGAAQEHFGFARCFEIPFSKSLWLSEIVLPRPIRRSEKTFCGYGLLWFCFFIELLCFDLVRRWIYLPKGNSYRQESWLLLLIVMLVWQRLRKAIFIGQRCRFYEPKLLARSPDVKVNNLSHAEVVIGL